MSGTETTYAGFFAEARQVAGCAADVWRMIPRRQQVAFLLAGGLMAVASGCNVAFPLLLGNLVDTAKHGVGGEDILGSALGILGTIAGLYVVREVIQVARRSFVEAACTKLERHLSVRVIAHTIGRIWPPCRWRRSAHSRGGSGGACSGRCGWCGWPCSTSSPRS